MLAITVFSLKKLKLSINSFKTKSSQAIATVYLLSFVIFTEIQNICVLNLSISKTFNPMQKVRVLVVILESKVSEYSFQLFISHQIMYRLLSRCSTAGGGSRLSFFHSLQVSLKLKVYTDKCNRSIKLRKRISVAALYEMMKHRIIRIGSERRFNAT